MVVEVITPQCVDGKIKNKYYLVWAMFGDFICNPTGVATFGWDGPFFNIADSRKKEYEKVLDGVDAKIELQELFGNTLPTSLPPKNAGLPQIEKIMKGIKYKGK